MLDSHGMMLTRQRARLTCPGEPLVIGRDLACDVVLNDPYVAARHASIALRSDGAIAIEDLGTHNGLIVGDERVRAARVIGAGITVVQVGHTRLHLRAAFGPLPPERPDRESLRSRHREYAALVLGAGLATGFAALLAWLTAPDDPGDAFATLFATGAGVLGAWFGFWVLVGRAVRSRWLWMANGAITLAAAAAALWLHWGGAVATFVTGYTRVGLAGSALAVLVVATAVFLHLRAATRVRRGPALALAVTLPALAAGGYALHLRQQQGADVNFIPPPAPLFAPDWSRQPGVRLDRFIEDSLDLRDLADQRRSE